MEDDYYYEEDEGSETPYLVALALICFVMCFSFVYGIYTLVTA